MKITDIKVSDNRRAVDPDKVKSLAKSIETIGLLNPIVVNLDGTLIAGAHRIEAFKLLGRDEIPASIIDANKLIAELAEIHENLIRNDLHWTEKDPLLARTKQIYLELYPETAHGAKNRSNNYGKDLETEIISTSTFTQDTANKTGESERNVRYSVQRGEKILPGIMPKLKELDISKTDGTALARIEPEQQVKVIELVESKKIPVSEAVREIKREEIKEVQKQKFAELEQKEIAPPTGKYDVIVIDPPWEMEKIKRDVAPEQIGFDYPTMSIDEIKAFNLPNENDCHVFMWITHKHLPMGFEIFKAWDVKYVMTFVWHKNGGFQPFGLPQYNCEFILYGRIGTPQFTDLKSFNACFNAQRTGHSSKPEVFYETIRRVTAGKRIDIFNRRKIEGFDTYGNESE